MIFALFSGALAPISKAAAPKIYIAEPTENRVVAFDHFMLEGSVSAGANLEIDGRAIAVGRDGLFIEWLPLRVGLNVLHFKSALKNEYSNRELRVTFQPNLPLAATPTQIDATSLQPAANWKIFDFSGSLESRSVTVSFRGSPGGVATFRVGGRGPFPMRERQNDALGIDTNAIAEAAYENQSVKPFADAPKSDTPFADAPKKDASKVEAPRVAAFKLDATKADAQSGSGIYEATFVARDSDDLRDAPISFELVGSDGRRAAATSRGQISAQNGPLRVGIVTAPTIGNGVNAGTTTARNGVRRAQILPLKTGAKFVVFGEEGDTFRARIAPDQSVNIPQNQMRLLPLGAPLPHTYLSRIETRQVRVSASDSAISSTQIRFLLPERVPFSIEQSAPNERDQSLELRLFNTENDIDFLVSKFPDDVLRSVRWIQESDGVLRVHIDLKARRQWGFQSFYDGKTLVLQVKNAPQNLRKSRPLRGRKIVVDAGHGGRESGAAGAFGVDEKDLVLDIARRLAAKLKARGAIPILTRDADVTLPLYDRPLFAETQNADLLVSIHGNALPDGQNPANSRGAGVYYFLPQAQPLAETLLTSLLRDVPQIGDDGLHYQNLALTRPSSQPSVLVETAFLTDKENLRFLMTPSGREKIADALARGLEDFYHATQ